MLHSERPPYEGNRRYRAQARLAQGCREDPGPNDHGVELRCHPFLEHRVVGASWSTHHDDRYYSDPDTFDPFRWAELREEGGESLKHQFVRTSPEYIAFGHGSHAWYGFRFDESSSGHADQRIPSPGRFFATNELKTMMAHNILNYDLKLEVPSAPRDHVTRWHALFPSPAVRALFRKRQDTIT